MARIDYDEWHRRKRGLEKQWKQRTNGVVGDIYDEKEKAKEEADEPAPSREKWLNDISELGEDEESEDD